MAQQLYAKIKKSSKYFDQNWYAERNPERWGWPFAVQVCPDNPDPAGYIVQGGPGGQYRLSDVNLYVIESGHEIKIK